MDLAEVTARSSELLVGISGIPTSPTIYPLVMTNVAMENHHHFQWENPLFRLGHFQ